MGSAALMQSERVAAVGQALAAATTYRRTHQRDFVPRWYRWQQQLFASGATHRERLVLAGNRTGKTMATTYEHALHITGDYPDDWPGLRIMHAGTYWALGVDNRQLRDVLQRSLIGDLQDDGTISGGWLHPEDVQDVVRSQVPGLVSDIVVRNRHGGSSRLGLRSYTQSATGQGTLPFAGSSVDGILVDEQPPDDIVGQLVTRTMTGRKGRGGYLLYSMTPELGETELVRRFMGQRAAHQDLIGPVAWADCDHLTPELQEQILASIPEHEREMRSLGIPLLGQGRIFTASEDHIRVPAFDLSTKPWLRVLRAIDIGIDHPTAVVWVAHDPESDTVYVVRTYRQSGEVPSVHVTVANSQWRHAPLVVPPDIDQREKGSGKTVRQYYLEAGVATMVTFTNPDGSNYVEPGIMAMEEDFRSGKLKVFADCPEFFDEYRSYHRKNGKIVAERDDVMSATRYAVQMVRRYGVPLGEARSSIPGNLYPDLGLSERHSQGRQRAWR